MRTRQRLAAVLVAVPLVLTGCSGADDPAAAPTTAAETDAAPQPGDVVDSDQFFETMTEAMLAAGTYSMTMTMDTAGETITMSGQGDVSDPDVPRADITITDPGGVAGHMQMIVDGESVFMQMPGIGAPGQYVRMPLGALSQAGGLDLTALMNPAENLRATQGAVEEVVYQGEESETGETLYRYSLTMNTAELAAPYMTQGPQDPGTLPEEVPYEVLLDSENRMRMMTVTFEDTTMTMTADRYGEPVSITAPPDAAVTDMPGVEDDPTDPADPAAPTDPAEPTDPTVTGGPALPTAPPLPTPTETPQG